MKDKAREQKWARLKQLIKVTLVSLVGGLMVTAYLNLPGHSGAVRFAGVVQAASHSSVGTPQ